MAYKYLGSNKFDKLKRKYICKLNRFDINKTIDQINNPKEKKVKVSENENSEIDFLSFK